VTARQETSLNQRALRALAAVADGLHNRVLNLATVVGQAGKKQNMQQPRPIDEASFKAYLKEQAPDLISRKPKDIKTCIPKETTIEAKLAREEWDIEFNCGGWLAAFPVERAVVPYLQGVPSQMFDEVLIADDKGAVLYQSLKTGILINNLGVIPLRNEALEGDSAKKSPTPSVLTLSQTTTVSDVSIGGQDFKFYMMPIAFTYRVGTHDSDHMVAVGLIFNERFRNESMALPGAALNAFGLSVLVIIFAAWPDRDPAEEPVRAARTVRQTSAAD
jgi:hypothetical protein